MIKLCQQLVYYCMYKVKGQSMHYGISKIVYKSLLYNPVFTQPRCSDL